MRNIIVKLSLILSLILLFISILSCSREGELTPVTVDILKIGKADCIVINTGTNIVMIDTGEEENLQRIHSYMNEKGYDSIDALILTHYDKDHIGGAADIISEYNVTTVYESSRDSDTEAYQSYHDALYTVGVMPIKLYEDYSFELDDCKFKIIVPEKKSYSEKNSNNSSLVISMEHGDNRFLFCGDAMEERLRELIKAKIGKYDFIKLPYHGNYLENYSELLDEIDARYGVVTCSDKNPADERALALFKEYGILAYKTSNGTVTAYSDGKELQITQ